MSSKIQIGKGTYGLVFLETDYHPKIASKYVARGGEPRANAEFIKEWEALKKLSHPNIIQVYELAEEDFCGQPHYVIRMEYCARESLRQVLKNPTIIYSMKTFYCWAEHLLAGLVCLERNGIVHRDLKPDNILVTREFTLKLGDFGCVRNAEATGELSKQGTVRYMSPECAGFALPTGGGLVNCKSDLYSVGLIMWEIIERRKVFGEIDELGVLQKLIRGSARLQPPVCTEAVQRIIMSCVRLDFNLRPTARDAHQEIVELRRNYTKHEFEPILDAKNQALIRPMDFESYDPDLQETIKPEPIIIETIEEPTIVPMIRYPVLVCPSPKPEPMGLSIQDYLDMIGKIRAEKILLGENESRSAFEEIISILEKDPKYLLLRKTLEDKKAKITESIENVFIEDQEATLAKLDAFFSPDLMSLFVLADLEETTAFRIIQMLCSCLDQLKIDLQAIVALYKKVLDLIRSVHHGTFEDFSRSKRKEFHDGIKKLIDLEEHPSMMQKIEYKFKPLHEHEAGLFDRITGDSTKITSTNLLKALNSVMNYPYTLIDVDSEKLSFQGLTIPDIASRIGDFSTKKGFDFVPYIFDWYYGPGSSKWDWQLAMSDEEIKNYQLTVSEAMYHYFIAKDERFKNLTICGNKYENSRKFEALQEFFFRDFQCPSYFLFFRTKDLEFSTNVLIPLEIPKDWQEEESLLCINVEEGCIDYVKLSLDKLCLDVFVVLWLDEIKKMLFDYIEFAQRELEGLSNMGRELKKKTFLSQMLPEYLLDEPLNPGSASRSSEQSSIDSLRL